MKFKSFISKILVFIIALTTLSVCQNSTIAKADSFKVVTLGNDLTDEQKSEMLKYFNVTENDANILTITSAEEYEALGDVATPAQLGTRAISCSYVEPTTEGGLDIKSNNLTWVTVGMILAPPGEPKIIRGLLSSFKTMVGLMELRGFFPPSTQFGESTSVEKSLISLLRTKP